MPKDTRARFLKALKAQDAAIYRAFVDAMRGIHNSAEFRRLMDALEAGDDAAIMSVLGLDPQALDGVQKAIRSAFYEGAAYQVALAPRSLARSLEISFSAYHPRIISWMERNAAQRVVTDIEEIRKAVRRVIATGMAEQRGYRKIALDLVGRMDGNMRKGGVIGLLDQEAGYVTNARRELASLDGKYLSKKLRDKRYDGVFAHARRDGWDEAVKRFNARNGTKHTPESLQDLMASRYSSALLKERGRRIARTEGNRAMSAGRAEHIQQMIDRGEATDQDITKEWRQAVVPGRRDSHAQVNGETRKWDQPYSNGMMRPHEEGAPAAEVVNCGCVQITSVDWAAVARRKGTL